MEQIKFPRDSDSRNERIIVSDPSGNFQRCYCFLCGKPAGWISKDSSQFVSPEHVVATCETCDHNTIEKYGDLPFDKIPTELLDAFGIIPERRKDNVLV